MHTDRLTDLLTDWHTNQLPNWITDKLWLILSLAHSLTHSLTLLFTHSLNHSIRNLLPLSSSNVFAIPNWMSIDINRPHRVTKCPQKPQSDPTVCHFDWVLTIFINFEGVARDWWGFQGYRYTQGTFWCNIQAKKITTVFGPPFRVFYYLWPPQMYLPSLIEWVLI